MLHICQIRLSNFVHILGLHHLSHTKAPSFRGFYFKNKISLLIQRNQIIAGVGGTVCLVLNTAMCCVQLHLKETIVHFNLKIKFQSEKNDVTWNYMCQWPLFKIKMCRNGIKMNLKDNCRGIKMQWIDKIEPFKPGLGLTVGRNYLFLASNNL